MRFSGSLPALAGALALSGCLGRGPAAPGVNPPEGGALEEVPLGVLRSGAEDLEVEIRMKSLGCLVRCAPEPGGGAWTARALWDPSPYVRRAALGALALRLDEAESRDAMISAVGRADMDPYTRGLAGTILVDAGDRRAAATLSEAWRRAPAPWQAAPLALAAASMGDPEATAAVARALEAGEFPLEVSFFLSIGQSNLKSLVPALEEAASSVEEDLLLPVAVALIGLGAPEGETIFRQALAGTEDQRMEALDYLADLGGHARLPPPGGATVARRLVRSIEHGDAHSARYARLVRVGWGEAPSAEAVEAADHPDREIRTFAIRALGRVLGDLPSRTRTRALDCLTEALADPEPMVRLAAIRALGLVGRPDDRDLVRAFLVPSEGRSGLFEVEAASALLCPGLIRP